MYVHRKEDSKNMFYEIFFILLQVLFASAKVCTGLVSSTILLNDGTRMPRMSFGSLGTVSNHYLLRPAVREAFEAGYRQVDTAAAYQNEEFIGEAVADVIRLGFVKREDLWITTKLNMTIGRREDVVPALRGSLRRLKLDYVDLYLIHSPDNVFNVTVFDYVDLWKGMEDAKAMGLARSIGVSNFKSSDINRLLVHSTTVPSVNEIEASVTYANLDTIAYCQSQNIAVLAYAPFGFLVPRPFVEDPPRSVTFDHPLLVEIADKYHKNTSQIALRYLVDRGIIPIPRSTNINHINSNIDIFDFSLTQEEIYRINELDTNTKAYIVYGEPLLRFNAYYSS